MSFPEGDMLNKSDVPVPTPNWWKHNSLADFVKDMLCLVASANCHIGMNLLLIGRLEQKPIDQVSDISLEMLYSEGKILEHTASYLLALARVFDTTKPSLESYPQVMYANTCVEESLDWLEALVEALQI